MPRNIRRFHRLMGFASLAVVGLPLTALAQAQMPDRMSNDSPSAPQSGSMPDLRGAMPGVSNPAANSAPVTVDTLSAMNSDDLIGANVRNSANEVIGKIDSLLLTQDARIVGAVIDVGGFLGIGAHQVVVPMEQLSMIDAGNVNLPAATKESLKALPAYEKPQAR